ncbi:hypothetical protein GLOTRDRAFT_139404, partial [Gloeophyllum trabeum ATCC 11539]
MSTQTYNLPTVISQQPIPLNDAPPSKASLPDTWVRVKYNIPNLPTAGSVVKVIKCVPVPDDGDYANKSTIDDSLYFIGWKVLVLRHEPVVAGKPPNTPIPHDCLTTDSRRGRPSETPLPGDSIVFTRSDTVCVSINGYNKHIPRGTPCRVLRGPISKSGTNVGARPAQGAHYTLAFWVEKQDRVEIQHLGHAVSANLFETIPCAEPPNP